MSGAMSSIALQLRRTRSQAHNLRRLQASSANSVRQDNGAQRIGAAANSTVFTSERSSRGDKRHSPSPDLPLCFIKSTKRRPARRATSP
jgi:hypothetical protein